MIKFHNLLAGILILLLPVVHVQGQTHGLDFRSHEAIQDQRTGLALGMEKAICFDDGFELSFEISFIPNQKNYFGYILRMIADDGRNTDLIYDYDKSPDNKHFKIVTGETFSTIAFNMPGIGTTDTWHNIRLQFDAAKSTLRVIADGRAFEQPLALRGRNCYKLLFGANDYKSFKNTDVPPMMIRNVRILEDKKLRHCWPLNEDAGNMATDSLGRNSYGIVTNPLWVKKLHTNWRAMQSFTIPGAASVAFDQGTETLYILGKDSLFSYAIPQNRLTAAAYSTGPQFMSAKYQSWYLPQEQKIYTFSIHMKDLAILDLPTLAWNTRLPEQTDGTNYCHFNKYYSPADSSFYTFNGYGFFLYKSDIYRYQIPTATLSTVAGIQGSMTPRYLAALGAAAHGAYIMGGYGNVSGQQVLNPKNLYDLNYFDATTRSFKKIYDLKVDTEEYVFANSLVIDEATHTYYGLIFPKHKYDSELQLIHGSLEQPSFEAVGDKLPYRFHDIRSFADLYYDNTGKRFIVPALFYDEERKHTTVNIYTLYGPPLPLHPPAPIRQTHRLPYLLSAAAILLLALSAWYLQRRKKQAQAAPPAKPATPAIPVMPPHRHSPVPVQPEPLPQVPVTKIPATPIHEEDDSQTITPAPLSPEHTAPLPTQPLIKVCIYLFGDFRIVDSAGEEVTKLFTPLIRELFLVILLYSIRRERGISSEKLKELLWSDKSDASARNNRSVNIAKLKHILERIGHIRISKDTGYWKIDTDPNQVYIDYSHYLDIVRDKSQLTKQRMTSLADIIQRGSFLSNDEHEWLDPFKSEVSNEIIDTYMHFATSIDLKEDPDFLIKLANYVAYFDPVNEDTMSIKCKSLAYLGKHSLARDTFEHFGKEYKRLYGEDFEKNFQEILE
ncbi:galactose oxidase [Chitinophaga agrisoli]|uniref:Galactose oxidase n=1 Tax=Chitinophaga agrisoli TaxID=2607653 RepID=A0A5B2VJ15_9BACT|nr:galactose oxidase [Chitinophaga agrisoli]KAA2238935.1 galactose oxidase [Chitinophaga agrisoli]